MKKNRLVAAQIGCGKFAYIQDLVNLTTHPDVDLKWVCDISADRAEETAKRFHVPHATTDFMEIIADSEVDFIKIATSHEVHLPIVQAAAKAGKHVFCEKPMAMTDREGYLIMQEVKRSGIKFCVDLNRRMAPAMIALKNAWQQHKTKPIHNPWRYVEGNPRKPLPEENLPHLNIRIQDESSSYGLIHLAPLSGGGEIIGESVHWLDLACWLFAPALPCEITAWGSSRLSHGIYLKFTDGASMTLDFSCSGTFDYPKEQYELTDNAALFRSLGFVENQYYGFPGAGREFFPLEHGPVVKGQDDMIAKYFQRVQEQKNIKSLENSEPFVQDKGHQSMLDGFVKAIQNDTKSPCTELDGFRATYLANRAIAAIESHMTLPIPVEKITPCIL
ncbi:MAG: Gfo/Idh/MocA family oxidoreductase [Victivallales bacterium]|nr:Gfo/Idh/MocA family oxidoreductase [Victivallales bacterium]